MASGPLRDREALDSASSSTATSPGGRSLPPLDAHHEVEHQRHVAAEDEYKALVLRRAINERLAANAA